jgi:hypothetical protein
MSVSGEIISRRGKGKKTKTTHDDYENCIRRQGLLEPSWRVLRLHQRRRYDSVLDEEERRIGKRGKRTFQHHNLPPMPIRLAPQLNNLGRQSRHSAIVSPSAGLRELFEEDKVSDGLRESCESASE